MTSLDDLDKRIEEHLNTILLKGIWAFAAFILANVVVFSAAVWWAGTLDERVDRNTAVIATISNFAERQGRTEETLKAIDTRTQRIERQMDSLWNK